MRRDVFSVVLFVVLTCSGYGLSVTVGNPAGFPEEKKFSFGFDYWNINGKDVVEYDDNVGREIESSGAALRVSYGLTDSLALDLRVGQADFTFGNNEIYDNGRVIGLGVRALVYESTGGVKVMAGVQYNDYSPDDARPRALDFEAEPDDFTISVDVSKEFAERFTMYGGLQHSDLTFKYFHEGAYGQREGGYEQDKKFGLYGGFDVKIYDGLSFFTEGHFGNEEAYALGLTYKMTGKTVEAPADEAKAPSVPPIGKWADIFEGKFHIGAELSRFTDKKMTEEDGYVPEYSAYRMASDRMFLVFSYDIIDRITLFTKLGKADIETHSSEGETTGFDSEFALAVGARGRLFEFDNGLVVSGELSYLGFKPEDGDTISTAKEAVSTPGDLSIDWSELSLMFDVSRKIEETTLFAGIRFISISADQDREFADGTVVSSKFDAEDDIGLFVGIEHAFTDSFSVMFKADFVDMREYTFGGIFGF